MIFAAIPFKLQQFGFAETNRVYACRLAASIVPPVDVCSHSAFQLYRTMYDVRCIKLMHQITSNKNYCLVEQKKALNKQTKNREKIFLCLFLENFHEHFK